VSYHAERATGVTFKLQYLVEDAEWTPRYALRLDTEAATLSITQVAEVTQDTAEDWPDVELTLSTAASREADMLPKPESWLIDLVMPPKEEPQARSDGAEEVIEEIIVKGFRSSVGPEYASYLRVPGTCQVPADDEAHRFRVAEHRLAADIGALVMAQGQDGFLSAEVQYAFRRAFPSRCRLRDGRADRRWARLWRRSAAARAT
jgi:hypothetical protein